MSTVDSAVAWVSSVRMFLWKAPFVDSERESTEGMPAIVMASAREASFSPELFASRAASACSTAGSSTACPPITASTITAPASSPRTRAAGPSSAIDQPRPLPSPHHRTTTASARPSSGDPQDHGRDVAACLQQRPAKATIRTARQTSRRVASELIRTARPRAAAVRASRSYAASRIWPGKNNVTKHVTSTTAAKGITPNVPSARPLIRSARCRDRRNRLRTATTAAATAKPTRIRPTADSRFRTMIGTTAAATSSRKPRLLRNLGKLCSSGTR